MSKNTVIALFITGALAASSASYADHMSIWGEGFANMPNDIHNTRIEDDDETFMDLVQYGGGPDSVNRYDDDSDTTMDTSTMATSRSQSTTRLSARTMSSRAAISRPSRR